MAIVSNPPLAKREPSGVVPAGMRRRWYANDWRVAGLVSAVLLAMVFGVLKSLAEDFSAVASAPKSSARGETV